MDTSLSVGLSALRTAQKALDTAGHNIANANTPNFTRQRVITSSIPPSRLGPLQPGRGVVPLRIDAVRDGFVDRMLLTQDPLAGAATRRSQLLSEIESLFSTDPESGLGAVIDGFFNSFRELSRNPSGSAERGAVGYHAQALADGFNDLAGQLATLRRDLLPALQEAADNVNTLAAHIAALNTQIRDCRVNGGEANDLIDQRLTALRELAQLVPVEATYDHFDRADVRAGGLLLVANDDVIEIGAVATAAGFQLTVGDSDFPFEPAGGQLGALLDIGNRILPGYLDRLDTLASSIAREINQRHATGVGRDGGFTSLTTTHFIANALAPLNDCDLPFELQAGDLYVSVVDQATGEVTQTKITLNPYADSLTDLANALGAVDHLNAEVGGGRLQITADAGYAFDFTNKAPSHPGSLGTAAVTLEGNVGLDGNDVYTFTADASGAIGVGSNLVADPANTYGGTATLGGDYTGATNRGYLIEIVDGGDLASATCRISEDGGATWGSTLSLAGGTIDVFDDVHGADLGLDATFTDDTFAAGDRFVVNGVVDLTVTVTDSDGLTVAVLDVGEGYEPGAALELPGGLTVSFAAGDIDGAAPDSLSVELAAEPDAQGVLAALGLNTFLRGTSATTLSVEPAIATDLDGIAAARSSGAGDNSNALRLAAVQEDALEALGEETVDGYYAALIGRVGLDTLMAQRAEHTATLMLEAAENQRDAISAVNQDEEAVNLLRYQQLYLFAARYLSTIDELLEGLMSIL